MRRIVVTGMGMVSPLGKNLEESWSALQEGRSGVGKITLFDAETFSSACGLIKPDPEIYLTTLDTLGVEPEDALFVGDGANDELGGAARVGMTPVLFVPRGEPQWPALAGWEGLRISSLDQVLELV